MVEIVTAQGVDDALTFPALVDALRDAFRSRIVAPVRHHHAVGDGPGHPTLLIMPAWTSDAPAPGAFLGTKIVNVFPGNGALGLPAVLGSYLLMSGETGAPLAVIDGTRLTQWRTASASALASSYLSRPDASRLTVVGAGALAPFLARAHASQRPIRSVTIWNHRAEKARAVAAGLAAAGIAATATDDLERAVREADIVSCATLSSTALVKGAWLAPGSHLDLVGAFTLSMRECDDEALQRSSVFVDTEAALSEGGEVAQALLSGAIERPHVIATLVDLCRGLHVGRRSDSEITLFKSVGTAIEDLAAAMAVWHAHGR